MTKMTKNIWKALITRMKVMHEGETQWKTRMKVMNEGETQWNTMENTYEGETQWNTMENTYEGEML
jgi:hypothetical protein